MRIWIQQGAGFVGFVAALGACVCSDSAISYPPAYGLTLAGLAVAGTATSATAWAMGRRR